MPPAIDFERRKHPRFIIDLPVRYNKADSPRNLYGRAMNVSEGGLLIYSYDQMNVEQELMSNIFFLSGSELNTIELKAEVVWTDIDLNKAWGDFRSGLKFVEISQTDMGRLKNLIVSLPQ